MSTWVPINKILRDEMNHLARMQTDPEYRAEQIRLGEQREIERRQALSRWQRWKEDHPNYFRKFWPWTVHRWGDSCCDRSHVD